MSLTCPICLEIIRENNAAALPCGHIFDKHCTRQWVNRSGNCAVCRAKCTPHSIISLFNTHTDSEQSLSGMKIKIKRQEEYIQAFKAQIKQKEEYIVTCKALLKQKEEFIQTCKVQLKEKEERTKTKITQLKQQEEYIQTCKVQLKQRDDYTKTNKAQLKQQEEYIQVCKTQIKQLKTATDGIDHVLNMFIESLESAPSSQMYLQALSKKLKDRCSLRVKSLVVTKLTTFLITQCDTLNKELAKVQRSLEDLTIMNSILKDEIEKSKQSMNIQRHTENIQILTEENDKLLEIKEKEMEDLQLQVQRLSVEDRSADAQKNVQATSYEEGKEVENMNPIEKELALVKNQRNRLIRESSKYKKKCIALENENKVLKINYFKFGNNTEE